MKSLADLVTFAEEILYGKHMEIFCALLEVMQMLFT